MRWGRILTASIVIAATVSGCVTSDGLQPFDASRVRLLQEEPLMEGEDIAVISTEEGKICIRFFPSEAPQAVKNFMTLSREGFYNGKDLTGPGTLMKQEARVLLTGGDNSSTRAGVSRVNGGRPFEKEISANLWHFTGAVSVLGNKNERGDSRFFITGTQTVGEDVLEDLTEAQYPADVVTMFRDKGGAPQFSLDYSVFGQVVSGQEVIDRLITRMVQGKDPAVIDSISLVVYQGGDPAGETVSPSGGNEAENALEIK